MGKLGRAAAGMGEAIGAAMGWRWIAEGWAWMGDGVSRILPTRHPWSKRAEWSAPPKSKETFEGAMYRMGVDEAGIRRSHACLGFSAYIAGAGFLGIVALGVSHAASGSVGGALAAIGMAALTGAVAATHSFRCWKLRKREINSGFGEFAASPSSWLPPLSYKREG